MIFIAYSIVFDLLCNGINNAGKSRRVSNSDIRLVESGRKNLSERSEQFVAFPWTSWWLSRLLLFSAVSAAASAPILANRCETVGPAVFARLKCQDLAEPAE